MADRRRVDDRTPATPARSRPAADQLPPCARRAGRSMPGGAMLQPGWARPPAPHVGPAPGARVALAARAWPCSVRPASWPASYALTSLPGGSAAAAGRSPVQVPPVPVSEEHWVVRAQATVRRWSSSSTASTGPSGSGDTVGPAVRRRPRWRPQGRADPTPGGARRPARPPSARWRTPGRRAGAVRRSSCARSRPSWTPTEPAAAPDAARWPGRGIGGNGGGTRSARCVEALAADVAAVLCGHRCPTTARARQRSRKRSSHQLGPRTARAHAGATDSGVASASRPEPGPNAGEWAGKRPTMPGRAAAGRVRGRSHDRRCGERPGPDPDHRRPGDEQGEQRDRGRRKRSDDSAEHRRREPRRVGGRVERRCRAIGSAGGTLRRPGRTAVADAAGEARAASLPGSTDRTPVACRA